MSINKYTKSLVQTSNIDEKEFISITPNEQKKVNIKNIVTGSYDELQGIVNSSKIANILIPGFLIILGSLFIYKQFFPDIQQAIQSSSGYLSQGTISPVSDKYITLSQYISNPTGLSDVSVKAFNQKILEVDTESQNFHGTFYISIPSLNINHLPVTANVDSTTEQSYNTILNNTLAHFQNTGLPISNVDNNIVIYGHSASPNYNPQPTDPVVAFSFLPNLKVGDDIIVEIEGKTYNYKMQKSKIVSPDDTSIITGTRNKRTLTLFTCYPAGNNTQRYVAIARPV